MTSSHALSSAPVSDNRPGITVQQTLFGQIVWAVRIAALFALALTIIALVIPTTRGLPTALLAGVVAGEWALTEYCLAELRRVPSRARTGTFIVVTMLMAISAGIILRSPAFLTSVTALLIVLGALLVSPRLAIVPGAAGFIAYSGLVVAEAQSWHGPAQLPELSPAVLAMGAGFSGAALGVLVAVSLVTSRRFQESVRVAHAQAAAAEQERQAQARLADQLAQQVDEQRRLLSVIRDLESPVMPVARGVVVLPIIGHVDSDRARRIEQRLLDVVTQQRASLAVIDLTGMPVVGAASVQWVLKLAQAVRLIGCEAVLSGISPDAAQIFAQEIGGTPNIVTVGTLADALERGLQDPSDPGR